MLPSNRELAALLIILGLIVLVLVTRAGRKTARSLLSLVWGKLLVIFTIYTGYTVCVVLLAQMLGLWRSSMLGETIAWFLLSGVVLFGRFTAASSEPRFFRKSLRALVEAGALVAIFASIVTFNLAIEVMLALVITMLGVLKAVADADEALKPARAPLAWTMAAVGFAVGAATVWTLVHAWNDLDKGAIALSLCMAIWLPAAVLPMVVFIGTFAAYETAFIRMEFLSGDPNQWRARAALVSQLLVRPHLVAGFSHAWRWELRQASSLSDARAVVRKYRQAHTRSLEVLLKREARALRRAMSRRRLMPLRYRKVKSDAARLLEIAQRRPTGWEFILFGAVMAHLLKHVQSWEEIRQRRSNVDLGSALSPEAALKVLTNYPTLASEAMDGFASTFATYRQDEAFGAPGEAGDPVRIVSLAQDVIRYYARLRDLGYSLSGARMQGDWRNAREALLALTDEPASQIDAFVGDTYLRTEQLPALLADGGPIELIMRIELTVSDAAQEAVEDAFSKLRSAGAA